MIWAGIYTDIPPSLRPWGSAPAPDPRYIGQRSPWALNVTTKFTPMQRCHNEFNE